MKQKKIGNRPNYRNNVVGIHFYQTKSQTCHLITVF